LLKNDGYISLSSRIPDAALMDSGTFDFTHNYDDNDCTSATRIWFCRMYHNYDSNYVSHHDYNVNYVS
jgi:hypothetical protein